jgi:hypothetical protein
MGSRQHLLLVGKRCLHFTLLVELANDMDKIKWIKDLPAAIRSSFKENAYASGRQIEMREIDSGATGTK